LSHAVKDIDIDIAVIATAGIDTLRDVYNLAERGITLAIANKECIVSAGKLIADRAKKAGSTIIPVDSEHSAIFQCLLGHDISDVDSIVLTASGGAFRDLDHTTLDNVTPEQALDHPTWKMGKKITIDSATMMNKGLELIEARMLFDIPPDRINAVVHHESVLHAFVRYKDGSVLAQVAPHDMRVPIAYALGYPNRLDSGAQPFNFAQPFSMNFQPIREGRFPCFDIAKTVLNEDRQWQMAALNAINEVAVSGFLDGKIQFNKIWEVVSESLKLCNIEKLGLGKEKLAASNIFSEPNNIDDVLNIDLFARDITMKAAFGGKI
jgi:1-deoxy-D-xylulose-5-phosphate reductoisomerase